MTRPKTVKTVPHDDTESRVRRVLGYERATLYRRVTTYLNHVRGIVQLVEDGTLPSGLAYEKALLAEEHALATQVERIATVTQRNPTETAVKKPFSPLDPAPDDWDGSNPLG